MEDRKDEKTRNMERNGEPELRSEKVRHLIGKMPPLLIRTGTGIISVVLFLLLGAAFLVRYPETAEAPAIVTETDGGTCRVVLSVPYQYVRDVHGGEEVDVAFEGYPAESCGYVRGRITRTDKAVERDTEGQDCFRVEAVLEYAEKGYVPVKGLRGTASLLLSDKSIGQRIIEKGAGK